MSDKLSAVSGSSRTSFVQSQRQTVTIDRGYNLQVHKNTMIGVTVDRTSGYATAGYENKKKVVLQNSTDKQAAYEILNKTFK